MAFARDCIRHSRTATSKEVSDELLIWQSNIKKELPNSMVANSLK